MDQNIATTKHVAVQGHITSNSKQVIFQGQGTAISANTIGNITITNNRR